MRLTNFVFLFLCMVAFAPITAGADEYDFRKVKWGMTKKEILRSENMKPLTTAERNIIYLTELAGFDTQLVYLFDDRGLYNATYILKEKHSNKNLFIEDYLELKSLLKEKYGQPRFDKMKWNIDLYKNHRSSWGVAVSIGHLEYIAEWETVRTRIGITLSGDNFSISSAISYQSRAHLKGTQKRRNQKALDKL